MNLNKLFQLVQTKKTLWQIPLNYIFEFVRYLFYTYGMDNYFTHFLIVI